MNKYLFAMIIGGLGGVIFQLTHMPLPWTLGPLTSVAVAQLYFKKEIYWPSRLRDWGMVLLGYTMGRTFTPETGHRIFDLLPLVVAVTVLTIALCLLGGVFTKHFTGISLPTSFFGCLPAGLSQAVAVCEEIEGSDTSVVALMQTVRVITVVFLVPFISLHTSNTSIQISLASKSLNLHDVFTLIGYLLVIACLIFIGKFIKIPGRFIILPIIGTAVITLFGFDAPEVPKWSVALAQLAVGIRIGISINLTSLSNWKQIAFYSFINILGLIGSLLFVNYFISKFSSIPLITLFIGTAPGGMAEMGLTAMMVQADLPTVIAFQLFRLLCVLILVMPALSWWFKRKSLIKSQG